MTKITCEDIDTVTARGRTTTSFLAASAVGTALELLFKLLLHLFVVARDNRVKFITIINMPFRLIMILVMHNAELGLVLFLFSTLSCWLKALQIYSLESFNLKLIHLREMTHLTAATAVRASLPTFAIAKVISKHGHAIGTQHISLCSSIYTLEITISRRVLLSRAACHARSAILVDVRSEIILGATHL